MALHRRLAAFVVALPLFFGFTMGCGEEEVPPAPPAQAPEPVAVAPTPAPAVSPDAAAGTPGAVAAGEVAAATDGVAAADPAAAGTTGAAAVAPAGAPGSTTVTPPQAAPPVDGKTPLETQVTPAPGAPTKPGAPNANASQTGGEPIKQVENKCTKTGGCVCRVESEKTCFVGATVCLNATIFDGSLEDCKASFK